MVVSILMHTLLFLHVGFGTIDCSFTNEEGVGDCPDSFAIDGKRRFAWNVHSKRFGQVGGGCSNAYHEDYFLLY